MSTAAALESAVASVARHGIDQDIVIRALRAFDADMARMRRMYPGQPPADSIAEYLLRRELFQSAVRAGCSIPEAARRTSLSESRVRHLVSAGSWPSTRDGGRVSVPEFVFGRDGELPGIRRVAEAAAHAMWSVYSLAGYVQTAQPALGGMTPYDWLDSGHDPQAVIDEIGGGV